VTWERGSVVAGLRKLEEEAPFGKYANAAQAEWAERVHGGLRGEAGRHKRGWAEIWGELFPNKFWIFWICKGFGYL
jgi:hypothetical protein